METALIRFDCQPFVSDVVRGQPQFTIQEDTWHRKQDQQGD